MSDLKQGTLALTDAQMNQILEMSGAKSCIVILCDSVMPCAEALAGGGCKKPHEIVILGKNIAQNYAVTFISLLKDIAAMFPPKLF